MSNLFSDINVRNLKIKNRIVMPPMVCFDYGDESGRVTEKHIKHYLARAKGGVGLIIIEATCVNRNGRLANNQLGLWADDQIEGFSKIVEVCHRYDVRVLVQIHHAGLATPESVSNDLVAPSDYHGKYGVDQSNVSARALTIDEICGLQDDFVAAALRAKKAGLDGIELHGAHGYLISQFLSPLINKRNDAYGGSITKRTRFVTEIIARIRELTGDDFIIGCRMGSNEPELKTGIETAKELEKAGVDLLHVSNGVISPFVMGLNETPPVPRGFNYNWVVYGGTEIKRNVGVPVIVVNGIRTPEQANYLIEHDLADFTSIGRGLLVDPEWANKALNKQKVVPCINCKDCAYFRPDAVCPQIELKRKKAANI